MRRWIWIFFLIALCGLFFWRDILSIGLQGTVRWQLKSQIAFRKLSFQQGQIVLDDAVLLSCSKKKASFHVHAKQICVSADLFQKPIRVYVCLNEPHVAVLDGLASHARRLIERRSKWLDLNISVKNGSFEWKDGQRDPFVGKFSLENDRMRLFANQGSMTAQFIHSEYERAIDCSFEEMPISWMSGRLIPWEMHGRISGPLFVRLDQQKIRSISGHLRWDGAGFLSEGLQCSGGAASIEWEGEADGAEYKYSMNWLDTILSFPDRMKIKIRQGFFSRGQIHLNGFDGIFSNNPGIGLRWEMSGPSFSWEGKGFSKSRSMNWLESTLCMHDSRLFLRAEQPDSARNRFSLDLLQADSSAIHLFADLWPSSLPFQFERGTISGAIVWEECSSVVKSWKLDRLHIEDAAIHGDEWSLECQNAEGSIDHAGNASIAFSNADIRWANVDITALEGRCRTADYAIMEGAFSGSINGLAAKGNLTGSLNDINIRASHLIDAQSIEADANFVWKNGYELSRACLDARHLDAAFLRSIFAIDCEGVVDLALNYANGELHLDGAGSRLKYKKGRVTFAIDQLGQSEPFETGVSAVWEKKTRQWIFQTVKTCCECSFYDRKIAFEGQLELTGNLFKICVGKGKLDEFEFSGDALFALEDNIPFSFVAERLEGPLEPYLSYVKGRILCGNDDFSLSGNLLSSPAEWQWSINARVFAIQWGLLHDGTARIIADSKEGLIECSDLQASLVIGNAKFGLYSTKLKKCDHVWEFDFRAGDEIWDWGRLSGSAIVDGNHLIVEIDSAKSHLLDSPIQIQESCFGMNGSVESFKMSYHLNWDSIRAAASVFDQIDHSFCSLLRVPIQGTSFFEIDVKSGSAYLQLQSDDLRWNGETIPLQIRVRKQEDRWEIDRFLFHSIDLSCSLHRDENGWKIENGLFSWKDKLQAQIGGYLRSFTKYELSFDHLKIDLQNLGLSFFGQSPQGMLEGQGCVSAEWNGIWKTSADFDLRPFHIACGTCSIQNGSALQVHFSNDRGLFVHGLDFQLRMSDAALPIYAHIGLMQFDNPRQRWLFHHAQIKMSAASIGAMRQNLCRHSLGFLIQAMDDQHDIEFVADIDCSADFSSLTCSMREGFVPCLGSLRHLQNVSLSWDSMKMQAVMSAIQGGHSIKIGASVEFEPLFWGRIFLEDEDRQSSEVKPLTIEWKVEPNHGVIVRSIEGTFGGIEASFHAEDDRSLIGSARLQFDPLSEILPQRLGKVFRQLKMGKGFELKGRLFYDCQDLSNLSFRGLLSGKQCELFGFQIRNLLTQVEIHPSHVHLFELKASDSSGILTIDELKIHQGSDDRWTISMPLFKLMEFRPSLLQKAGCDPGRVGPLVVREMEMVDLAGNLEDSASFTAKGRLSFVNSFKREHTVFDLPSDFFGRIIGLDMELMIPVTGRFQFELKEGRFWLSDLEDAYSEGKRSKFFLVKEGLSPSIDLDGNLHIFVTMKQYVLFKITENFLLTIDGPIESPSFHLQKKSKLLGLCGY